MTDDELKQVKDILRDGASICDHGICKEEILKNEKILYHQISLLRNFVIERMVNNFQEVNQERVTQFPWSKTNHVMKVKRAVKENLWSIFDDKIFPLTVEDLVELGAKRMEKGVRYWGKKASKEVAELMKEFGYPDWENT